MAHRENNFGERGLGAEGFALFLGGSFGLKAGEALFEGDGDGNDGISGRVCFDPFADFGKVLVFLAEVVFFGEVDKVDDWFSGEEEERVDYFDLGDKY